MATSTLTVLSDWEVEESISLSVTESPLGDSYSQTTAGAVLVERRWGLRSWQTDRTKLAEIIFNLKRFQGDQSFNWSPDDGETVALAPYYCHEWVVTPYGPEIWAIEGELFSDPSGECEIFRNDLDEAMLVTQLQAAVLWLQTYTRAALPLIVNPQGVSCNSFHNVLGRGGYLPPSTGTTEGQAAIIRALLIAHNTPQLPAASKAAALAQAVLMAGALEPYFYGKNVPASPTAQIWLPHWVINAREPFVSKGSQSSTDFMNYGHFDVAITFTSGIGTVPGGLLADLYKVYSPGGRLLWRNVTSPLVSGTEFPVAYWVSNLQLGGQNYRFTSDYQNPGASNPVPTSEPAGKVVLVGPYTGTLRLIYSAYDGAVIGTNQRFDAFPMWRPLQTGEVNHAFDVSWWIDEAFELLHQATGLAKWQTAREANKYSTITTGVVLNESYLFKRRDNADPFSYPGTGYVVTNNSALASATRAVDGGVQLNVGDGAELYPSAELQNFAITVAIIAATVYRIQLACSVSAWIEVVCSLSRNAGDFTQEYTAHLNCPAGLADYTQVDIFPPDFARWTAETWWHSTNVENPVYTYQGEGGNAVVTKQLDSIDGGSRLATRVQLSAGGGYAGAGFVLTAATNQPPAIHYRSTTGVRMRAQDSDDTWHSWDLPPSVTYTTFTPVWTGAAADGPVYAIDLVPIGSAADVFVYWLGAGPQVLPVPCTAYKHVIRTRIETAYAIKVGDWQALNSPLNLLKYNPGAVPFTANSIDGAVTAWQGSLYVAYQNPATLYKWGLNSLVTQVLQCFADSQADYGRRSPGGASGLFSPVFYWPIWSEGVFGDYNTWGWKGPDPNTEWSQYTCRALEAAAKCWYLGKGDPTIARPAQRITMNALRYLDRFLRAAGRPPTNIKSNVAPQDLYHDPAAAALILRAAIWANLAGGDRSLTFRVIRRCWLYLQSQYVGSGLMAGSWSGGQPTFVEGGQTYREYFGFWQAEIIEALALLAQYRALLSLPPCATLI
jgi:phage-related protein